MSATNRITQLFSHDTTQPSPHTTPRSINVVNAASHVPSGPKATLKKATGFNKLSRGLLPGIDSARPTTTGQTETGKPWGEFGELYKLNDLEGKASVAIRKRTPRTLVIIQAFTSQEVESTIRNHLEHKNVCTIIKKFTDSNKTYTVFEHMDLTWEHIINCFEFPSELQLAALLGQVWLLLNLHYWTELMSLAPGGLDVFEQPSACSRKFAPTHCLGEPTRGR